MDEPSARFTCFSALQGIAGSKLERLFHNALSHFIRRAHARMQWRMLLAWRRTAHRARRLRWAARVWRVKQLAGLVAEWQVAAMASK